MMHAARLTSALSDDGLPFTSLSVLFIISSNHAADFVPDAHHILYFSFEKECMSTNSAELNNTKQGGAIY